MEGEKTTRSPEATRITRVLARAEDGGKRLDVLLAEHVPGLSRRRARFLIAAGSVSIEGHRVMIASRKIAAGKEVYCRDLGLPAAPPEALDPALVLHEDPSLIAIDKQAGVPSHPTMARKQGTALQLLEELLRRRAGKKVPLWPVHRLDTGTSGVLVFAKSAAAARALSQNLARRRVRKLYLALVSGLPDPPEGEIALPLAEGNLRTEPSPAGKEALTRYRVVEARDGAALVEVEPLTGRMHQIRVHLAAIGHPVVGDSKYGSESSDGHGPRGGRLHLHAHRIEFPHPEGGAPFAVESPLPPELARAGGP
jgi:23S rRNA pseudouridine1911/1915/1917 synthase